MLIRELSHASTFEYTALRRVRNGFPVLLGVIQPTVRVSCVFFHKTVNTYSYGSARWSGRARARQSTRDTRETRLARERVEAVGPEAEHARKPEGLPLSFVYAHARDATSI